MSVQGGALVEAPAFPREVVARVLAALGGPRPVAIFAGPVDNAAAVPADPCLALPAIVYNSRFLDRLEAVDPWAPIGVIAHEIGHHLDPDRSIPDPWRRELAADRIAGCALARLGATANQASAALRLSADLDPSNSHPTAGVRLRALAEGYARCR